MEVVSDRRYQLPAPPADVWVALARTDDYRSWWPWLRSFDARGLELGDEWRCTIRPPLPYVVRFRLLIENVERPAAVTARLRGDIEGTARIDLAPADPSAATTELRLRAALAPGSRAFALLARIASPLARRGHDWVLDTGARQFAARALHK
jgi:uncharacterized protein YndB with AHSA1/START domain